MWALRRASVQLRNRGLTPSATRIFNLNSEVGRSFHENYKIIAIESQGNLSNEVLFLTGFYNTSSNSSKSYAGACTFSSQAGAKNTGDEDDDLEDAFSELEAPVENGDGSVSESDVSEDEGVADDLHDELETSEPEKKSPKAARVSAMTKAILASLQLSVSKVLDKWVEEGNEVTQEEASLVMLNLRKRRLFGKALQLSEWLEATKSIEFSESNYASRLDLIAKLRGISKAEEYLKSVPETFRGELVYRTLLANCVSATNIKKSEEVFNKMRDLGLPLTCFACNQLIILYKRVDKKKIADVLMLMEKENIKPSLFTYQLLIDVKGMGNDINGMEQIVETLKSEGLETDPKIQTSLVRHYTAAGLKDKAEEVLKEIEGNDLEKNRWVCRLLLPIYASLKKEEDVARIWKICESNTRFEECTAAIEAWGQLGKIENAEAAFEKLMQKVRTPSAKHYTPLLYVYANHKMLAKGKDLMRRMMASGCKVGPLTWDALVKLYVGAGEVEKADSMLEKALEQKGNNTKPLFATFSTILNQYAKRGDVHNAEEIFLKMRQVGYVSRLRSYELLLQAYINAKAPAYGFRERMKADNVFPNKFVFTLLAQMNAFRKSAAADFLE